MLKSIENDYRNYSESDNIELWTGKALFCPTLIVKNVILATIYSLAYFLDQGCPTGGSQEFQANNVFTVNCLTVSSILKNKC